MATAIDNLGRKIDSSNMTLGEIKALVGTMMKSKVGAARPVESKGEGETSGDMGKIRELLEQYTKDFAQEMQEQKGFLADVVDNLKDLVQKRIEKRTETKGQPKKEKKDKPFVSKEEKAMSKSSEGLYKTFAKKGSGYTHDIYVEKAIHELCNCLKGITPATPSPAPNDGDDAGGGGSGGNTGGAGAASGGAAPGGNKRERTRMMGGLPIADDLAIMSYFIGQITNELAKVEQHILGFNTLSELFKGTIKQEREFVQGMRAIGYETAGATKEAEGLMRSFEDIGTTTKQTGVDRDVFQKSYVKALKHGIKDLKVASNIVKTQLNTEKQLGMEAGSLSEEFVSWNKAGRMSLGQIADMGRGMREIARSTGMTGDELASVVKGSKEFIDSLRNAATLSATTAKNVIEIGVNAKKLGIEGQMQPLLKAMSSSSNLILEASSQTRAFLLSAAGSVGRIDELMNGTILRSKAGIKDMAKGMDNMLKRFGVESMDAIDQLSDDAKMRLNVSLKATFGIELGELRSQYEALNEAGKGMAERLADINKKRQQNLTLEEKATLMEDERRLKTSKNLEVLTALDEAAKGAKDMNQALATFGKRRGEFEADLSALGQAWTSEADVARGAIQNAMNSVNAGLKKSGKQEIKIDSTEIERALKDPAAMRELTGKIAKGEQELATAQKAQLDPMTDMQQSLSEINDNIRNFTNKGFSSLFNSLIGKIAVIGAAIAGVVGGISLLAISLVSKIDSFSRVFKEMDDRGGWIKVVKGAILGREKEQTTNPADTAAAAASAAASAVSGGQGKNTATATVKDAIVDLKNDDYDIFPLMLKELQAIHKCVCMDKSKFASDKAAGQAKAASMSPEQKVQERTARRQQEAETRLQKRDIKLQKNDIKSQKVGDKVQDAQQSLVGRQTKMAAKSSPMPATPSTEGFDIAGMMGSGKEMAKAAIAVAILGLGVVALGAAIVFLSSKIMKAFKLDIKTVLETAAVVGAVALAGGAIAAAGVVAFQALNSDEMKGFTEKAKSSYPQVLKAAAALMLIGPAIVLIGAAVVALTGLILSKLGLNLGSVAETAAVVVAVAGVAGAMAAGAAQFVECLDELKKNKTWNKIVSNPGTLAKEIGKSAAALLLVGGAIMLLGVALVKMGQVIMSVAGLDGATAAKVGMQVAGLIIAAGAIAGAVIGAAFGLKALGEFATKSTGLVKDMAIGAAALLIMTPAITLLATAVVKMSQAILGSFGMDSGVAAKAAMNIAELLLSTGFIALAVIGASAGLIALGTLVTSLGASTGGIGFLLAIKLMAIGAAALLLMTPAITALAASVVLLAQKVMGSFGLDLGAAAKVAKDLAGIIMAAGFISLAVMGTAWALSALASLVLTGAIWPIIGMAAAGGAALLLLTPAITALASGIIYMAQAVMKNTIDPSEAGKVAEALSDVIGAAAEISISVLGMGAALAALGFVVATGLFWTMVPLALLGAAALLVLTPAVVALNTAIIYMAQSIMKGSVSPEEAKMTSEALASILASAASISWSVIKSATTLGVLGLIAGFSALAWVITGAMYLGSKALQFLTPAVVNMANTIIQMAGGLMATGVSPAHGKEIADALSSILGSAGSIAEGVLGAVGSLSKLGLLSFFAGMIAGFMWMGVGALETLAKPVKGYIGAVVDIAKSMGSTLNPKQAAEMAQGVADVLAACGDVTNKIMATKKQLLSLPASTGFWSWLTGSGVTAIQQGVDSLTAIKKPIIKYVEAIVDIAQSIGGKINPKKAVEMAQGVADILAACGAVADELIKAKNNLVSMSPSLAGRLWKWMSRRFVPSIEGGIGVLKNLEKPITSYVEAVVKIAKSIGSKLDPKQAVEMGKGVAEILAACGAVTDELMKTKDRLFFMSPSLAGRLWAWLSSSFVPSIEGGIDALKKLEKPVTSYVEAVIDVARSIGGKLNPSLATSMARGVADVLNACGAVTEEIMKTKDNLMSIKSSQGFWIWATSIEDSMNAGVSTLNKMKKPIMDYVETIVGFSKDMGSKVDVGSAKSMVKSLTGVSTIVELVSKVLNTLSEKIVPLTQGGWFSGSPIKQMTQAKGQMEVFFPAMVDFIKTIVDKVRGSMGDTKDLKSAAKGLHAMAMILNAAMPSISIMSEKIAPLTQGGFFTASPVDKIKAAIPQFNGFFDSVGDFVNTIAASMTKIKDTTGLKEAAKKMRMLAIVLDSTSKAVGSLASMVALMDDGFFTKSPITKIIENKKQFGNYFGQIAEFVNTGIVGPINNVIPDAKKLQNASVIVTALARLLCGTKITLESLVAVIGLMEPKWFFQKAPLQKIMDNKDQFKEWFIAIANFVNNGIVKPVNDEFKDPSQILNAAKIVNAMAVIAKNIVPMIKNLASAISLATDSSSFFSEAPIPKIINNKEQFGQWFQAIAIFMRDGIVNPVNKEMAGIDISGASKTIMAMAKIAANIVPLIKNLSGAMSLMSSPAERYFDSDFPIDKIMVYKGEFALWFKSIAIFMRDGIVNPILNELPEPRTIMMAAQILSAMSRIVTLIPIVINNMANGLIPLIDSGESLKDTAKEKMEGKTKLFGDWFTSVAAFMRDGIIFPILNELPEPRTIMMASKILSAMSRIFTLLPSVISKLSALFVPLDASKCLKDSPVGMLAANTDVFSAWFYSITSFVRDGILYPIMNNLPTAEEITAGMSQMSNMSKGLDAAEQIIAYVSERMNKFSINPFWMMMASWKASMFGYAFMGMANAINNGILQPMKLLPPSSEIDEVVNQLDGMVQALNKVEEVLGAMDIAMKSISNSGLDFSALDKIPIQKMAMFASALKDMTAATSMSKVGGGTAGGGAAGTPSDKAIETQLLRDQSIAQQSMATSLTLMVNEAMTGDGLFVRDRLNFKAQNDMIKIQRDEAKSALMPTAAQTAAIKSDFGNGDKKLREESEKKFKEDKEKANLLKPAIQSVNPRPAAGNIDMRRASESMRDTPMQRALGDEARERRSKNPYTDRLKERNEARRIRREQAGFETGGTIMPSQGGNVRGSVGSPRGEAHGQGLMTEQAMAQAIERQAREAQGNQPIGYKLANAASAQQIANQGMMPSVGPPQMATSEVDALASLTRLINQPTSASGMIAQGPISVEPMSVTGTGESSASIRPLAQTSPAMPDMHSAIAGERASTSPVKTEITSPELGAIASEAGDHNAKLDTLITLFQQVLDTLKPRNTPITSGGGIPGDTATRDVVHKPANYFRNTVGLASQTAGKAALNLGPQTS
jgi:hypothetical protein